MDFKGTYLRGWEHSFTYREFHTSFMTDPSRRLCGETGR
jgi:hypothetical protein